MTIEDLIVALRRPETATHVSDRDLMRDAADALEERLRVNVGLVAENAALRREARDPMREVAASVVARQQAELRAERDTEKTAAIRTPLADEGRRAERRPLPRERRHERRLRAGNAPGMARRDRNDRRSLPARSHEGILMSRYLRELAPNTFLSYQGVPIAFEDDIDSSIWRAVPLSAAGLSRFAVHVAQYHEGGPSYHVLPIHKLKDA
jgi:hypothetical protein